MHLHLHVHLRKRCAVAAATQRFCNGALLPDRQPLFHMLLCCARINGIDSALRAPGRFSVSQATPS